MIRISVLYPNDGSDFDFTYYVQNHIKLVHELLDPYGLVRTEVDKGLGTNAPEGKAPYVAIAHLYFSTFEDMQKGMMAHDPDLAADVPNFTTIRPTIQISEIL